MILEFYPPAPPLGDYVELLTYYEGWVPGHSIERLLPDGATHLIVELDQQPKYIFDNDTLVEKQKCSRAWVSGMHTRFLSISTLPYSAMLVVRFRPGGSFPFFHLPIGELKNLVVDAEQIVGPEVLALRERLFECTSPAEKFRCTEAWLLNRARAGGVPEAVVQFAVDRITAAPTESGLKVLAAATGYSQKQFIHLFRRYVGLSPKQFQRITRFNHVLAEIDRGRPVSWAQLSHDCGYYDQAHFIREFQAFAGFSPETFLGQDRSFVHYVTIA